MKLRTGHERDFRAVLQDELVNRCRKNPKYSLRAFARSLGIGPSALSDMINGKRSITDAMKFRLGLALGMDVGTIEKLPAYRKTSSGVSHTPMRKFERIDLDTYAIISDWYHYAILELMKVEGFRPTLTWISRALGISNVEAKSAVERLFRAGLLSEDETGRWIDTSDGTSSNIVNSRVSSAASRKLQAQILEQSLRALRETPIELRNHTSMTMAIDPECLPEAIEMITAFRRGLCEFLESKGKPKQVYQLSISLFPSSQVPTIGDSQ